MIYYASRILDEAQHNYTTTNKELLAVEHAMEFRFYLLCSKVILYTGYFALMHVLEKKDAKPFLIRWILILQEFDQELKDEVGAENVAADHISRLIVESPDIP